MEGTPLLVDAMRIASNESFEYDTLPRGEYFRYLVLHPGADDEPLECSLHTTALAGIDYEAISYVWGTEIRDHDILCAGRKLKITKNLHQALSRLRYPAAVRLLWADSICIHQQNLDEKAHQVANMGQIYAEARRVLLYMGPDPSRHAPDTKSLLSDMRNYFDRELAKFDTLTWGLIPFPQRDDPILLDSRWHSLEIFLRLPWFRRGWVVREAGLARDCLVVWGECEFSWTDLMRVAHWLLEKDVIIASLPSSYHPIRAHMDAYCDRNIDVVQVFTEAEHLQPNRLLDYLTLGRYLNFKDRRDGLFAFFDLANDSANEIRAIADYSQSLHEIFHTFAIQYLRTTSDVSMLDYISHETELPQTDLPTWVPTWDALTTDEDLDSSRIPISPLRLRTLLPKNGDVRKPEVLNDELLKVHSTMFDSVDFLTEPLKPATTTPEFVFHLWLRVQALSHTSVYTKEGLGQVFVETLIRYPRGDVEEYVSCICAYIDWLIQLPLQTGVVDWTGDPNNYRKLQYVQDCIQEDVRNKRFMMTKHGHLGMAPPGARQGDTCAIIFGCVRPCLLRPTEQGSIYKHIGPAFIKVYHVDIWKGEGSGVETTLPPGGSPSLDISEVSGQSVDSQHSEEDEEWYEWYIRPMGTEDLEDWWGRDVEEQDIILC